MQSIGVNVICHSLKDLKANIVNNNCISSWFILNI